MTYVRIAVAVLAGILSLAFSAPQETTTTAGGGGRRIPLQGQPNFDAMLSEVAESFGSLDGYLANGLGVSDADRVALRSGLLRTGAEAPGFTSSTHVYKTVDGHGIRADVYRASGDETRPVVMWVHGGALIFGTREWLEPWQLHKYLDAGFVVVAIDYRLAPESKLPAIIEDLEDAYAWVRAEGPRLFRGDPDRVAVVGHSAGGYLALAAGYRLAPRPRAVVSFYGYGDLTGAWYSRPSVFYNQGPAVSAADARATIGDSLISSTPKVFSPDGRLQFYVRCRQQGTWPIEVAGHDPEDDQAWFAEYEPLRNVTADYPATLLLHGEKDTDVPFEQTMMMVEALRRHDVAHEVIRNPDWGHMFDFSAEDQDVQDALARVVTFLERHVE